MLLIYSLGTGKETEEPNLLQQLSDACLVVDALEPSVREDLVKNFCSRELTSYQQIFEGAGLPYSMLLLSTLSVVDFDGIEYGALFMFVRTGKAGQNRTKICLDKASSKNQ